VSRRKRPARPALGDPRRAAPRRLLRGLRDARIRSKLGLILVVPVVTIVSLAGLRLVDSGRRAVDADLVGSLTTLSANVSGLTHDLHRERMAAAMFLASAKGAPEAYNRAAKRTDEWAARYTATRAKLTSLPTGLADRLRRIDEHLATLNATRQEVLARQNASVSQVVLRYGVVISDLVAYREEVAPVAGDSPLADELRAAAAFSKAKAAAAEEQAVAYAALAAGHLDDEQFSSFLATLTGQQEALVAFSLAATPFQRELVESSITGDAIELADHMATEITRSVGGAAIVTADEVSNAVGAVTDLMRWAEQRLDQQLIRDAGALRTAVLRQVFVESGIVLVTLLLAVAFALLLARSMARSLGRLREGALSVAHRDLPDAVARLRDVQTLGETSPDQIAKQIRDPIALRSRDEIGQVGQAFNVVHREAVRIAAEQAALRTSVSAMFLNLARRSQTLVDRMIGELDHIERTEEDPKRLSQLFQLDHLATRMRRNDENLLVLAGADSSAPRRDDALLVDALRAAQSEVELYDRVEFGTVDTDVSIAAHAVNDVVRMVAELLDNATRFSPPNTVVVADARRIGDYVLVQIEDHGLGLSDEQLDGLNTRLAQPSTVDVAAFRMMGLAVVARLAGRYQIRVELRRNVEGGTVANLALPSGILVLPKIRGREPLFTRARAALGMQSAAPAYPPREWSAEAERASGWSPGEPVVSRPPVSVGLHVTGAAASSAAAAAAASLPVAGLPAAVPGAVAAGGGTAAMGTATGGATTAGGAAAGPARGAAGVNNHAGSSRHPDETTELPIFREMEAAWFRSHGPLREERWGGAPPPPASAPPAPPSVKAATPSGTGQGMYPPPPQYQPPGVPGGSAPGGSVRAASGGEAGPARPPSSQEWRTAADTGWQAASQASEPRSAGTTRSGLPKRVPMDQLVPGGVDPASAQNRTRRTPEEVRGLLSAYHRGVQRGRAGGDLSKLVEPER
jgi:signal transduction histidine kinase